MLIFQCGELDDMSDSTLARMRMVISTTMIPSHTTGNPTSNNPNPSSGGGIASKYDAFVNQNHCLILPLNRDREDYAPNASNSQKIGREKKNETLFGYAHFRYFFIVMIDCFDLVFIVLKCSFHLLYRLAWIDSWDTTTLYRVCCLEFEIIFTFYRLLLL
jgi:hypothetical protein